MFKSLGARSLEVLLQLLSGDRRTYRAVLDLKRGFTLPKNWLRRQQIHLFCLMWHVVKYFTTEHVVCLTCSLGCTRWLLATLTSFIPLHSGTSHCPLRQSPLSANSSVHLIVLLKHTLEFFIHAWHCMFCWALRHWKPLQPPKCIALVCCVIQVPTAQEVQPKLQASFLLLLTFLSAFFVWYVLRSISFSCPTRLFAILRMLLLFSFLCNHFGSGAMSRFGLEHVLLSLPATALCRSGGTHGPCPLSSHRGP